MQVHWIVDNSHRSRDAAWIGVDAAKVLAGVMDLQGLNFVFQMMKPDTSTVCVQHVSCQSQASVCGL